MLSFSEMLAKEPSAGTSINENSMNKFVENFSRGTPQFGFRNINLKSDEQKGAKVQMLTLNNHSRKRLNEPAVSISHKAIKHLKENSSRNGQFNFLPVPDVVKLSNVVQASTSKLQRNEQNFLPKSDAIQNTNNTPDPYRSLSLITGNVEFAMKINKIYGNTDLLYEIYAKIVRISAGKYPCEYVILLRNDIGPVLQAVYYEIDTHIPKIQIGNDVRCVGKFKGSSRIHLFKLTVLDCSPNEESLIRLQNLCNFTMNKVRNNDQ